jgi:hypothetical protein
MKRFLPLAILLSLTTGALCAAQAPTKTVVETVLKGKWEAPEGPNHPRTTLQVNSVKFGSPYQATVQEVQVDGLPQGAVVTPTIVDFTVRTYDPYATHAVRRVREARVYKDKFGEWEVMTGSPRGQDQSTEEPPVK